MIRSTNGRVHTYTLPVQAEFTGAKRALRRLKRPPVPILFCPIFEFEFNSVGPTNPAIIAPFNTTGVGFNELGHEMV
jgi:hypothetical protein